MDNFPVETKPTFTAGLDYSIKMVSTRTSRSPIILKAVDDLLEEIGWHQIDLLPQQPAYLKKFKKNLLVILCNLVHAHQISPDLWVGFYRGGSSYKKNRKYKGFQFSRSNVRKVTDYLIQQGYVEFHKGYPKSDNWKAQSSKMRATQRLIDLLDPKQPAWVSSDSPEGLESIEFYHDHTHSETVVMKGKKKWPPKEKWKNGRKPKGKRDITITPENKTVRQMRSNLKVINKVIQQSELELDVDEHDLDLLNRKLSADPDKYKNPVDFSKEFLYRVFVDRDIQQHGRFYGGWWEGIPEDQREKILINGMPTVEVDFTAIHPYILYGMEGKVPPKKDPYPLPGYPKEWRKFLKRVLLITLNAKSQHGAIRALSKAHDKAVDKATRLGEPEPTTPVPLDKTHLDPIIKKMKAYHEPIARYFFQDLSNTLMYHDSLIIEDVLLHFAKKGIACLPVHDSVIVDVRLLKEVGDVMCASFKSRFNIDIPVDHPMFLKVIRDASDRYTGVKRRSEWYEMESELIPDTYEGDLSDFFEGR